MPTPRVAVLVRGHEVEPKFESLVADLSDHRSFDTFVLFNVRSARMAPTSCKVIEYDQGSARALGFEPDETLLYYCCDLLFEHARRAAPDYDFYIMLEYDVDCGSKRAEVMDLLVEALSADAWQGVDMVLPELKRVDWPWVHAANARRFFDPVWAGFPSIWVMSRRAIERTYRFRLEEGAPDLSSKNRVICEALASLFKNSGEHRVENISALLPRCYDYWSMYYGLPMLQGMPSVFSGETSFRHPVYGARAFLGRHLIHAQFVGDLSQYIGAVSDPDLPIETSIRNEYICFARDINQWQPRKRYVARSCRHPDLPVVLLVEDDDLPVRNGGTEPRSFTPVAGRPLYLHVLHYLQQAGFTEITIVTGPPSEASVDGRSCLAPGNLTRRTSTSTQARPVIVARWDAALDTIGPRRALVVHGNVVADIDFDDLVDAHEASGLSMTVASAQGCSVTLAAGEAVRLVTDLRPGWGDLRVEAGAVVVAPDLVADMRRHARPARELLAGRPKHTYAIHPHTGVCLTVNDEREAALAVRMAENFPDFLPPPLPEPSGTA